MSDKEVSHASQEEPLTLDTIRKYFDARFSEVAESMVAKDCIDRFFAKINEQENRITEHESRVTVIGAPFWAIERPK